MSKHDKRKLVRKCSKVWRDYGRFLSVLGCVSLLGLGVLGLWTYKGGPKPPPPPDSVELIPGGLPRPKGAAPVYDAEKAADHAAIFLLRFQRYNDFRKIDMTNQEFADIFVRTDLAKSELSNKATLEDLAWAWARHPARATEKGNPDSAGYYWWFYRHTADGRTKFLLLAEPATGLKADPWLFAYGNEIALLNGLRAELLRPLSEEDVESVIAILNRTEDARLGKALVDFLAPKYARPKKPIIEPSLAQKTLRAFQRDLLAVARENAGKPPTVEQIDACWERNLPAGKEGEVLREQAVFTFTGSGQLARLHLALRREDGKSYTVLSSISLAPDGEPVEGGRNHILETVNHAFPVLGEPVVPKEVTQALQAGGEQEFEKVWEAVRAVCQEPAFADQWPASMVIHRRLRQQGMDQALEGKSWVLYPNDAGVIYLCRFPVANMNSKSAVGVKADLVAPLLAPKCQPVKPAEAEPGSVPLTLDVKNWEDNQPLSRN